MTYLVRAVEVRTTVIRNGPNAKSPANEDDRTGEEGLDALMGLEPSIGRGPHVTRDESTQGEEKQKSDDAEYAMSDDHSVPLGQ